MSNTKSPFELALSDLKLWAFGKAKKGFFIKQLKLLSLHERTLVAQEIPRIFLQIFRDEQRLDPALFQLCTVIQSERDWQFTHLLLSELFKCTSDHDFFRELAVILFELTDSYLDEPKDRTGHAALILLTEMGILLAGQSGKTSLDPKNNKYLSDFITTNLLARSNVNHIAIRVVLVNYLSRFLDQTTLNNQLNRVIGRFGQSLLEELLTNIFSDKKKENASLRFLLQHLTLFFSISPSMGEMTHNVLRHYMLKYPQEFPGFISSFAEHVSKDADSLHLFTKHCSLLLRSAIDIGQRGLAEQLTKILCQHLHLFINIPGDLLIKEQSLIQQILTQPAVSRQNVAMRDDSLKNLTGFQKMHFTLKPIKLGQELTPLDHLFILAS